MRLYTETGNRNFLQPIPRAIDYLRRSQLADGRLARFYELQTNKPLYFTKQYVLTYDDGDVPTHYAFKISSRLDNLAQQYDRLAKLSPQELAALRNQKQERPKVTSGLEKQVRAVIAALDDRGAWVEDGQLRYHGKADDTRRVIDSRTFIKNVELLSRYLGAVRK